MVYHGQAKANHDLPGGMYWRYSQMAELVFDHNVSDTCTSY